MKRCPMCPSRKLPIEGEGPQPAQVMFIGEAPGKQEDRRRDTDGAGRPFIGESGQELRRQYLRMAGLKDHEVYITNCVKCIPHEGGDTPSDSLAKCCSDTWIGQEIRHTQPEIIVTLGAVAYHTLFPGLPGLEYQHGLPIWAKRLDWEGWVIPMYHPAAGLRQAEYMMALQSDFRALGRFLEAGLVPTTPQVDQTLLRHLEATDGAILEDALAPCIDSGVLAMDTETDEEDSPYCMSFCTEPDTGWVIRGDEPRILDRLAAFVTRYRPRVILHNAPFDLYILSLMGIKVDVFTDTMVMAYHLGDQPQSLKVLAYRLLGMDMQEFDDVVTGPSLEAVYAWAQAAIDALALPPAVEGTKEQGMFVGDGTPYANPFKAEKKGGLKLYKDWIGMEEADWARMGESILLDLRGKAIWAPASDGHLSTLLKMVNGARTGNEKIVRKLYSLLGLLSDGSSRSSAKRHDNPWRLWDNWPSSERLVMGQAAAGLRGSKPPEEAIHQHEKTGPLGVYRQWTFVENQGCPMPRKSLRLVDWPSVVRYSAQDAIATFRIYFALRKATKRAFRSLG